MYVWLCAQSWLFLWFYGLKPASLPLSMGFCKQEHWSGLPFPFTKHIGKCSSIVALWYHYFSPFLSAPQGSKEKDLPSLPWKIFAYILLFSFSVCLSLSVTLFLLLWKENWATLKKTGVSYLGYFSALMYPSVYVGNIRPSLDDTKGWGLGDPM